MTNRIPRDYIHGERGVVVVVPGRVAAWLQQHVDLQSLRVEHRGRDAEVDNVLVALTAAAGAWATSATGSNVDESPEVPAHSDVMSTTTAADLLGVTDSAVRLACREKRLQAEQVDGRWRLTRAAVDHYASNRAS